MTCIPWNILECLPIDFSYVFLGLMDPSQWTTNQALKINIHILILGLVANSLHGRKYDSRKYSAEGILNVASIGALIHLFVVLESNDRYRIHNAQKVSVVYKRTSLRELQSTLFKKSNGNEVVDISDISQNVFRLKNFKALWINQRKEEQ